MENDIERWSTIKALSEIFEISNYGRIRSKITGKFRKPVRDLGNTGKIYRVRFFAYYNGEIHNSTVHSMVMHHFGTKKPSAIHTIDHMDRDPTNNHIANLRWATMKEQTNNRNTYRKNGMRDKISPEELHKIYLRTNNESLVGIAADYNISGVDLGKLLRYVHPLY